MNSHHTPRSGAMLLRLLFTGFAVLLLGALTVLPALAAGTWTTTGSMSTARNSFTATRLANGQVLVAGGYGGIYGSPLASAELFNPATGTWAATGSLTNGRRDHTATLLSNGQVLVVGGVGCSLQCSSAELFTP